MVVFFFWYVKLQVLYVADTRQMGSPAVTFTQGHGLDGPWGMVAGKKQVKVFITKIIDYLNKPQGAVELSIILLYISDMK